MSAHQATIKQLKDNAQVLERQQQMQQSSANDPSPRRIAGEVTELQSQLRKFQNAVAETKAFEQKRCVIRAEEVHWGGVYI